MIERFLHHIHTLLYHQSNAGSRFIGEKIRYPDYSRLAACVREDLYRRVVMGERPTDSGPGKSSSMIVNIDDWLAHHHAIAESHNPSAWLELCIDNETGH